MIVEVFITAAESVKPLGNQVAQRMRNAVRIAGIMENLGDRFGQADALVELPQQHQSTIGTDGATLKIRLDHSSPQASKIHQIRGTIWHRHSPPQNLVHK